MIDTVPATEQHVRELVKSLSAESWNGMYGRDPVAVLLESIRVSVHAQAVYLDGELCFIWGVREPSAGSDFALGWFMTSDAVERHRLGFWKASKLCVQELRERYQLVANLIDHRNEQTLRWAKGMGFTVYAVEQQNGRSFHRAEIRRPHV